MLTVKLYKGHVMKVIEAVEVNIFPCGKAEGSDQDAKLRTNRVREIALARYGGHTEVFYVSDGEAENQAGPGIETWDVAYIENAHGATTETVRPY